MKTAKYTKFGINYLDRKQNAIFSYVALDEANNCVLAVRAFPTFESDLSSTIEITCNANFIVGSEQNHEEISADEFWRVYHATVVNLYRYYNNIMTKTPDYESAEVV